VLASLLTVVIAVVAVALVIDAPAAARIASEYGAQPLWPLALMAMAVPPERFEEVAATVNAMPEVAHNYEREHALNMWFVVAAETPAEMTETIAVIEAATRALLTAEIQPAQVGFVNDRIFLINASVGLYPQLLEDREAFKQRRRSLVYDGRPPAERPDPLLFEDDAPRR